MQKIEIHPEFMTVKQVSAYLNIAQKTVYVWAEKNRMPAHKFGRLWRFKRCEIDGWVQNGHTDICYNTPACCEVGRMEA